VLARPADHQYFGAVDPLQRLERTLRLGRDRRSVWLPRVERLAGREAGGTAPVPDGCLFAAFDFFGQEHAQNLGVFPPLRGRGGDHLGRGSADVWQPHAPEQLLEL
jgi:hypothetical protein